MRRLAEGEREDNGDWVWFPRVYDEEIMVKFENDEWCETNLIRGETTTDRKETLRVRNDAEKYKVGSNFDRIFLHINTKRDQLTHCSFHLIRRKRLRVGSPLWDL